MCSLLYCERFLWFPQKVATKCDQYAKSLACQARYWRRVIFSRDERRKPRAVMHFPSAIASATRWPAVYLYMFLLLCKFGRVFLAILFAARTAAGWRPLDRPTGARLLLPAPGVLIFLRRVTAVRPFARSRLFHARRRKGRDSASAEHNNNAHNKKKTLCVLALFT